MGAWGSWSPSCIDHTEWSAPSGATCESTDCLHDSVYQAYSDGSVLAGVTVDTIAPDCLDTDCCKWRCLYSEDCLDADC
jgi:hypothetical protein